MRLDHPWEMSDVYPTLDRALARAFPNLRALSYEYRGLELKKGGSGDYLAGEYSNPRLQRAVSIQLRAGALVALIPRVSNGKDSFTLGDYLRHVGRAEEAVGLGVIDHRADLEPQLESNLTAIAEVLDTHLAPILQGKEWAHVPFNWLGYK